MHRFSAPALVVLASALVGSLAAGVVGLSTQTAAAYAPPKRKPAKNVEAEPSGDDAATPTRFVDRYAPENHMVDLGMYLGAFFIADNHGLFDRGLGPQPSLPRGAFDIGFRASYMPLSVFGVGLEIGGMPTRSPSEAERVNARTIRAHVVGQLPWRITPTLVVGGGVLAVSSPAPILNGGNGAFHWGPGAKLFINDWVAVRVDGRHMITGGAAGGGRAHYGELLFGLDVTLRVGRWVSSDRKKRNADRDGDLVPDRSDECPDEYGEDAVGCPRNRDRDKDGVPDRRDRCPDEWGDGPGGCPTRDKDNDGIVDPNDACIDEPETVNGFEDFDGCPDEPPAEVKRLTGVLEGIRFASGKTAILPQSRRVLDSVADTLKKYPDVRIRIIGHTDNAGSEERNIELSQQRADAVRNYLVDRGVEAERIDTRGAGPNEPVADNKTKAGRAKNRRIEFQVVGQPVGGTAPE